MMEPRIWGVIIVAALIGAVVLAKIARGARRTIIDERGTIEDRLDEARHQAALKDIEARARRERERAEAEARGQG